MRKWRQLADMINLTILRHRSKAGIKRLDRISAEMNASLLVIAIGLAALDLSVFTALTVRLSVPDSDVVAMGGDGAPVLPVSAVAGWQQ
jgi:hypothetical protein